MPPPHISITVKSTSGTFVDRFNPSNPASRVLDAAIKELNLTGSGYVLKKGSTVLPLADKLSDLGIVDGDVLVIQARQPQDG